MFKSAPLFIGLRYTRAKRRNHFISFISLVSMLGIALGVMVLITVLSVMNGFDHEIKKRIFTMVPPITVSSLSGYIDDWPTLQKSLDKIPTVNSSVPFVNTEVLLNFSGFVQPALINGILPSEEPKVSAVKDKMIQGQLSNLKPGKFGIVLGENLANRLNVTLGDKITVITPKVTLSAAGMIPRYKRFTLVGIFRAGTGFGFDAGLGFIHLQDAQRLTAINNQVSGLHLNIVNVYAAPHIANEIMKKLPQQMTVTTWGDQFGELFHAIQLEKTMMFLMLLLIIAVAAFNLVSTLVMVVHDKQSDIAILRTFGATPRTVMSIFIIQGSIVGIIGTLIGIFAGILLALNATSLVNWIEHFFNVQLISSNVYLVNYLPSKIKLADIMKISMASLFLSFLATIYPAFCAAKMDPVESLRYE